ncbi:aspartate-semialdehyde dehydrogenase [Christensenellaceae bacterium]|nr:aspartate-semialdehyde dehydrogenase [Christensenellaceae bacterium]BDF60898.1 aspartate-semialdehyde dehydrogenase [Christensenellaceae bacterium]
MRKFNVAVVGATGMVGRKFLQVLEERQLPVENYYLFASARSAGKKVDFMDKEYTIEELTETCFDGKDIDIALFSAGGGTSEKFAPCAVKAGALVIDNSSAWRMDPKVPLVVPEVNPEDIKWHNGIIANPNCSTIQAMVALKPLDDKYKIKRVVYSTYQAVSGAGMGGYSDLENGINGDAPQKFPYPIFGNCLPQIDVFDEDDYTKEELKMVNETRKILHNDDMRITATTVRVPVFHGHSESINVEFEKDYDLDDLKKTLADFPGLIVMDDVKKGESKGIYPMALDIAGKDEVYVGRIRRDRSVDSGVNLWVVADNIRKGAATNAVQIAQVWMDMQSK